MKLKKIINRSWRFVSNRGYRMEKLSELGFGKFYSDEKYLKTVFYHRMNKKLDLDNPQTFNEKLQWLKLYDRNPLYTTLVDKYEVKKYIADKIGEEYVIPTLGIWENFEDIDFDTLPEQFVLKCTHDSGGLVICKNKSNFNLIAARKKIKKSLKQNYFWFGREWPYKNVKPRIIAEKYMEDYQAKELRDYKFFCFNGKVKALFIATERQKAGEEVKFDFFDADFNHLPMRQGHPNAIAPPKKPEHFEEMKMLAEKLSADIPHVRVDFYEANGNVYFGELTFYHFSGITKFEPDTWDRAFGDWIILPQHSIEII